MTQNAKKKNNIKYAKNILIHKSWFNQCLDLLSTSKWRSEPQFCEYSHAIAKKWLEMVVKWPFIILFHFRLVYTYLSDIRRFGDWIKNFPEVVTILSSENQSVSNVSQLILLLSSGLSVAVVIKLLLQIFLLKKLQIFVMYFFLQHFHCMHHI